MARNRAMLRWGMAAACLAGMASLATPALADPPWGRGWRGHHHHRYGPPPVRYYPPPVYYAPPPPVYYAPPPVYYAPPPPVYAAPGLSFGLSIPLR